MSKYPYRTEAEQQRIIAMNRRLAERAAKRQAEREARYANTRSAR